MQVSKRSTPLKRNLYLSKIFSFKEIAQAQQQEEFKKIADENVTFKPKTNRTIKPDSMDHFKVG